MKRTLIRVITLLTLLTMLFPALLSCSGNDDEVAPDRMQLATLGGCYFRLYIPTDWTPLTDVGLSGGYYSMNDRVTAFVNSYDAPLELQSATLDDVADKLTDYVATVHLPALTGVYGDGALHADEPTVTTLGDEIAVSFGYRAGLGGVDYRGSETLCLHESRIYVLSLSAHADVYDNVNDVFGAISENFRFSTTPVKEWKINTVRRDASAPEGMKLASNNDVAYRFYVPESWTLDESQPTSAAYVSDTDRSNVTVTVYYPDTNDITADSFWETCYAEIRTALPDVSETTVSETVLDGRPAFTREYSASLAGQNYRFAQTYANYRGMFYTVTYTAEAERFDEHRAEYDAILAAFDFRGN